MFGWPAITGKGKGSGEAPHWPAEHSAPAEQAGEQLCPVQGPRFHAELTTTGASLRHVWMDDARYQHDGKPIDLVTTDKPWLLPLRTNLRVPSASASKRVPIAVPIRMLISRAGAT